MNKYYVTCGMLQRIVIANSPETACWEAILQAGGELLEHYFYVDERGYRPNLTERGSVVVNTDCLPEWTIPYESIITE